MAEQDRPRSDESSDTSTKTRSRSKVQPPSMWKVVLHNDDYTTQEFVVFILKAIFQKPEPVAVQVMLDVHRAGKGIAGMYTRDIAETKIAQVKAMAEQQEFPLLCTLERED
jgi:ATP-dependent Clp protease adaptor protein ClpS